MTIKWCIFCLQHVDFSFWMIGLKWLEDRRERATAPATTEEQPVPGEARHGPWILRRHPRTRAEDSWNWGPSRAHIESDVFMEVVYPPVLRSWYLDHAVECLGISSPEVAVWNKENVHLFVGLVIKNETARWSVMISYVIHRHAMISLMLTSYLEGHPAVRRWMILCMAGKE